MRLPLLASTALALLALASPASAADALIPMRFKLDWAWQAPQAIWTLAAERGYFREEGLDVTIDRGYGGSDTLGNIVSGAYDVGFGDVNYLVLFNAKNPATTAKATFVVYDASMAAVMMKKSSGITKPKDLEGKTIAAPETDGGRTLFPAFAKATGIDASKVNWLSVAIQLREPTLVQGRADAIAGFVSSSMLNLKQIGTPAEDITIMRYYDYGLDLYSSSLIMTPTFIAAHPESVKKFLRATMRGIHAAIENPKEAIASLMKRDTLLDAQVELDRLDLTLKLALMTPVVMKGGVSSVDDARLNRGLITMAEAFGVPAPKTDTVYDARFLPPLADRMLKQ